MTRLQIIAIFIVCGIGANSFGSEEGKSMRSSKRATSKYQHGARSRGRIGKSEGTTTGTKHYTRRQTYSTAQQEGSAFVAGSVQSSKRNCLVECHETRKQCERSTPATQANATSSSETETTQDICNVNFHNCLQQCPVTNNASPAVVESAEPA